MKRPIVEMPLLYENGQSERKFLIAQPPQKLFDILLPESTAEKEPPVPDPKQEEAEQWYSCAFSKCPISLTTGFLRLLVCCFRLREWERNARGDADEKDDTLEQFTEALKFLDEEDFEFTEDDDEIEEEEEEEEQDDDDDDEEEDEDNEEEEEEEEEWEEEEWEEEGEDRLKQNK